MEDFVPKPGTVKIGGLSRAAQKLQAAREKAENKNNAKGGNAAGNTFKAKTLAGSRKTAFQRKSV